jgi:predicted transcriptional regulator
MSTRDHRESAIIDGIERGLDDMRAGRIVSHKAAMHRLRATVARVAKGADIAKKCARHGVQDAR